MMFAKTKLLLLSVLAAYCIVGLQIRNGFFDLLGSTGPSDHLNTDITGFSTIDGHLGELLKFFLPTTSAESPSLSLFSFYMAGQVLPMQTLVLLEGVRGGNIGKIISYTTIWGVLYQSVPWGIVMPLYFALYLWTSPISQPAPSNPPKVAARDLSIHPLQLAVLPVALSLGFILPTVFAAIPPGIITTVAQQQTLLVFWQGFPIWIAVFQLCLTTILSPLWPSPSNAQSYTTVVIKLRTVYKFSLSLTALVHVVTIVFAAVPAFRPAYFVPASRPEVTLGSVFLPISPFSTAKVEQIHEGCLLLLQYDMYFACLAALLWARLMLYRVRLESNTWLSVTKTLFLGALVGPGGAALASIWERDEKVFGDGNSLRSKSEKGS